MLLFINVQRNKQCTNLKEFLEKTAQLKRPTICHSSFVSPFLLSFTMGIFRRSGKTPAFK